MVVLPVPCRPASRMTAGGWVANDSGAAAPPISAASSRCTTPISAWPGVSEAATSAPIAFCRTRVDELPDHRQRDVGLEQRQPHFAQRVLDVVVGEARLAAQFLDDAGKPLGEIVEHGDSGAGCRSRAGTLRTHASGTLHSTDDFTALRRRRPLRRRRVGQLAARGRRRRPPGRATGCCRWRSRCTRTRSSRAIVTPTGFDLSFANALSLVAGLAVLVAWASGLMRTLPGIAAVVLPVAAVCALGPAGGESPAPLCLRRRTLGRRAHRRGAARLRAVRRRGIAGARAHRPRVAPAPRPAGGGRWRHAAAADARTLHVPAGGPGLRCCSPRRWSAASSSRRRSSAAR